MNYNDLLDDLEGVEKAELLRRAKEDFKYLINMADVLETVTQGTFTKDQVINYVLCPMVIVATAIDGRVDKSEYNLALELFSSANLETVSIDKYREQAESYINEGLKGTIYQLLGSDLFGETFLGKDSPKAKKALANILACIFMCNGSLDSTENQMLKDVCELLDGTKSASDDSSNCDSDSIDDDDDSYVGSFNAVEDKDIVIVRHDAVLTRSDDRSCLSVGIELKNPNVSRVARNVNVKIIVKDANGRIIETSENTIEYIDSNAMFYFGDEMNIYSGTPSSYTVQVHTDEFIDAPENSTFSQGISFSHYNIEKQRWGSSEFTCNVHNSYDVKLYVDAYFVFYDDNNNITGGCNGGVGTLYGNSDDNFSFRMDTQATRSNVRGSASFDFFDLM